MHSVIRFFPSYVTKIALFRSDREITRLPNSSTPSLSLTLSNVDRNAPYR